MALQKYKHDSDLSYALGATLVEELLETKPSLITRIYLRPDIKHGEKLDAIIKSLESRHIDIIESKKAFNIIGAKDNCLLMAEFKKPNNVLQNNPDTPHIVLINPSDAGNLGTIIRTAAAFDFNDIAIITPAVDPYEPKVIRATMGAIFHVNIVQFPSIEDYQSQNNNRRLYAFILDKNAQVLDKIHPDNHNYSLVLGNEAAGLPKDFVSKTGATPIFIPQSKNVDSLNLSIAAGIAMHHFSKTND